MIADFVFVDVVVVADVERWVGKQKIDAAFRQSIHGLDAIRQVNGVERLVHRELRFVLSLVRRIVARRNRASISAYCKAMGTANGLERTRISHSRFASIGNYSR